MRNAAPLSKVAFDSKLHVIRNALGTHTTVQRVQIRSGYGERASAQLAVETVDFLRASLPGLWPLDLATSRRAAPGRSTICWCS